MKTSICIATFNKAKALDKTLNSIFVQRVPFEYEVIVVDDGSEDGTFRTCTKHPVQYHRIERKPVYRNPSVARNLAYSKARGEIVICQSDDVYHSDEAITKLTEELVPGRFLIATVLNVNDKGQQVAPRSWGSRFVQFTSPQNPRPLFFLGSLYREDLYAVGGNDEEFTEPGREDVWFADCLINGLGLTPQYTTVEGYHQDHPRHSYMIRYNGSKRLYQEKRRKAMRSGVWQARHSALWQTSILRPLASPPASAGGL